jgi:hypothetical protein
MNIYESIQKIQQNEYFGTFSNATNTCDVAKIRFNIYVLGRGNLRFGATIVPVSISQFYRAG